RSTQAPRPQAAIVTARDHRPISRGYPIFRPAAHALVVRPRSIHPRQGGHVSIVVAALLLVGSPSSYDDALGSLSALRVRLALELLRAPSPGARRAVAARARRALLDAFARDLFPAWAGTPWDYNGTATRPREGKIACGYFVTTLL